MGRSRDGQVLERRWKHGRGYALRFIAYGQRRYLTLGNEQRRLDAQARRAGAGQRDGRRTSRHLDPTRPQPPTRRVGRAPTRRRSSPPSMCSRRGGSPTARARSHRRPIAMTTGRWRITCCRTSRPGGCPEITIEAVDDYRRYKTTQARQRRARHRPRQAAAHRDGRVLRPLSAGSINKTIDVLQAVLALAVEYGHMTANPASGRRRRLKPSGPTPGARRQRPTHPSAPGRRQRPRRQPALAVQRSPRDRFNPPAGRSARPRALPSALARRRPRQRPHPHRPLKDPSRPTRDPAPAAAARRPGRPQSPRPHVGPDDLVFPTNTGGLRDKDNLRNRVLAATIARADELLAQQGHPPLPAGLTPHKLRHTFASILVATGEDPASVMAQLGHTDPKFTLRVYTHLMRREPGERARLKALVHGETPIAGSIVDPRDAAARSEACG